MREILNCLGAEEELPPVEGEEGERSRPSQTRRRGLVGHKFP